MLFVTLVCISQSLPIILFVLNCLCIYMYLMPTLNQNQFNNVWLSCLIIYRAYACSFTRVAETTMIRDQKQKPKLKVVFHS